MKKIAATGTALALALTMAISGCGSKAEDKTEETTETVAAEQTEEDTGAEAIKWTEAKTAEEAAKGAGLDSFNVFTTMKVGDLEFKTPTFGYVTGIAQATYDTPATAMYLRKADATHADQLTDRDVKEFAYNYTKTFDGVDVTMYGAARGATTYLTWKDGANAYGVTIQGLGGEEMSMDTDEVEALVKAVKSGTSATAGTTDTAQTTTSQTTENSNYIGEARAKELAFSNAGETEANATWTTVELKEGGDAPHYVVAFDLGGVTYTFEVDAITGDIWSIDEYNGSSAGGTDESPTLSEDEAISAAEKASGGTATNCYQTKSPAYGVCWYVATTDANNNVNEYFVDNSGNAYLIEVE